MEGILAKIAAKLGSDSAKVYDVIASAGVNKDDFMGMIESIGIELDADD